MAARIYERTHPFVAIHDAFDAARRQLDEYARCQRGDTKPRAAG